MNGDPAASERAGPPPRLPRLTAPALAGWFAAGLVLSVIFDADASQPARYVIGVGVGVLVLLSGLAAPARWLPYPLFVLGIVAPDLTQSAEEIWAQGALPAATPWQFSLGPVTPAMIIFGVLLAACLRLPPAPAGRRDRPLLWYFFIVVPLVSVLYGYAQESPSRCLTDAKISLFFCVGLVTFRRYYARYPEQLLVTVQAFLALAAGRFLLDACYLVFGIAKTVISDVNRVSIDSAKGVLIVLIFLLVALALRGRHKAASLVALPVAVGLLFAYQTRWLIVVLAAGALLVLFALGARRALLAMLVVGAILAAAVPVATSLFPEVAEVTQARFHSLVSLREAGFDLSAVDPTRVGSIANSTALLWRRRALLTGLGYGSWFSDDAYPMPFLAMSDFDPDSLASRRFYRVHDFVFEMLFKVGLIGLLLYVLAFVRPLARLWRRRRALLADPVGRVVLIVALGSAPAVLTSLFWTGKGLMISALFVACVRAWAERLTARGRHRA